ncbi:MAG: DUF2970 domain-containing protein [Pseudomonadales bacterium]|nr:DUF2970 domain-containing protein [Pseudomonadales bacterium]NRA18732.1 DUF2970 domain-containing protein [Oceanospirillaceae bacterium]
MSDEGSNSNKKLSWSHMLLSVCSAFFGVQSDKNRSADFTSGRLWPFIVMGIFVAVIFIFVIVIVVKLILH